MHFSNQLRRARRRCTGRILQGGAKKWNIHVLRVDIFLILVLPLYITEVGTTKTKQLIFFAILLMLEFILNILCDVAHDVFIKHVYDTVFAKKLSTFCILMFPPSLNLKIGLPIAQTWLGWITPHGVLYSSLFTDSTVIAGSRHWAPEGRFGNKMGREREFISP